MQEPAQKRWAGLPSLFGQEARSAHIACQRLSPLFYEDGQIFSFPALLDCLGVREDRRWMAGRRGPHTTRPGSAENGVGGLPLPGLMP